MNWLESQAFEDKQRQPSTSLHLKVGPEASNKRQTALAHNWTWIPRNSSVRDPS